VAGIALRLLISGYKLRLNCGDNRAMSAPTPDQVREFIAAGLPCEKLVVEGDGRHFFATIVSTAFEGLPRVRRHQRCTRPWAIECASRFMPCR
jgi:hypothetical protein